MTPLLPRHGPVVAAALLLGTAFAVLALHELAQRVRSGGRPVSWAGWSGGSLLLGSALWGLHWAGVSAFAPPLMTAAVLPWLLGSWAGAVAFAAVALGAASGGIGGGRRLATLSLTFAAGLCSLHWWAKAAFSGADVGAGDPWADMLTGTLAMAALAAGALALCPRLARSLRLQRVPAVTDSAAGGGAPATAETLATANEDLRRANADLSRRALLDPLTGLPNRSLLQDRLQHALGRRQRAQRPGGSGPPGDAAERGRGTGGGQRIAVLDVDLDGFRLLNEGYGHAAGDGVLQQVADRLRHLCRDGDCIARVGADEFVLLLDDVADAADATALARRIVDALRQPFAVQGAPVLLSASVGLVVHPDQGDENKLLAQAAMAMDSARHAGGNTVAGFDTGMDDGVAEQLQLHHALRAGIARGELTLHYQPKVDGPSGRIRGVEALVRWNHPQRGMLGPDLFIPVAERFGLIVELGDWVIEEACRQMRAWADAGVRIRVAVNVSAHQLCDESLATRVHGSLERHQLEASQLLCEITETVAMKDTLVAQRTIARLAQIGVFLSIDDFGTGYSSLTTLRQLPAKELKIDRSFVADVEVSADARAIVDAVIQLAHSLGLRVVSEGVETAGQRDVLLAMGCDQLQGFLFARPLPAEALFAWATGERRLGEVEFSPSVITAEA